jgi:hypothetical protein
LTPITTHTDAETVLRGVLPGIRDLRVFEYRAPSGGKSLDVPPQPAIRGWSCTVPRLGARSGAIAGSWKLPTTAERIADEARAEVDRAIALREREMLIEREIPTDDRAE